MIIKTRKLPATQTEGERMRATADNGATLTIPFPYGLANLISPYRYVANRLAMALEFTPDDVTHVEGYTFKVEE